MDIDSTLSYLFHSFHILALEYGAADSHGGDGRRGGLVVVVMVVNDGDVC